jgi:hypothetical protein
MTKSKCRKTRKQTSKQSRDIDFSVAAIHESGHAVGCWRAARAMGYEPVDVVKRIHICGPGSAGLSTTYRWMFSREMQEAVDLVTKKYDLDELGNCIIPNAFQHYADIIEAARKTDCNIVMWATSQILISVSGPHAEARVTGMDFQQVAEGPGRDDMQNAVMIAKLADWSDGQFCLALENALLSLDRLWSDPRLWNALKILAFRLPISGDMDGAEAWRIYSTALENPYAVVISRR